MNILILIFQYNFEIRVMLCVTPPYRSISLAFSLAS